MSDTLLHGGCACGRFLYQVEVPPSSTDQIRVSLDNSAANRRFSAAPVTAWLRVPLNWYHSTTYAFFPDETQISIRKVFHSEASTQRQFCGYCGTHLTSWGEHRTGDSDYISVTLGSLLEESNDVLERLGVLPTEYEDEDEDEEEEVEPETETEHGDTKDTGAATQPRLAGRDVSARQVTATRHNLSNRGIPWFESIVEGSHLKRLRGGYMSQDGSRTEQWEVEEWIDGNDDDEEEAIELPVGGAKRRKLES